MTSLRDHETRVRESKWCRCNSGPIGRRKSAVEDLLDALTAKLADEPRAWGDRVYVPASESGPLLRFARVGIIMCHKDGHEDAAGRFLVALASVEDVGDVHPWPSKWNWMSASGVHVGITVPPDDLHALVSAARYWASSHWPGIVAPVVQDIRSSGTCGPPRRATCTRASVRVCGARGPARSVRGWTC